MVDPVALPLHPEVGVPPSHLFYDQDGDIMQFLCSIILDVTAVSIEADVEGILHILLLASCAFDKECPKR